MPMLILSLQLSHISLIYININLTCFEKVILILTIFMELLMYLFHICVDIDVVRVPVPAMMAIVHFVIAMMGQGLFLWT